MPVSVKVNGSSNSLVHKGSSGISAATVPDVCKTPSPGGPVPIPYPNISQSATLANGTSTVKADGGMMIAIKGSEFSLSNGDNAGVAGGVKSSTFMKESTWVLYSFDVKMEGKNACRLTDKKFQNHENAADLAGCLQVPVVAGMPAVQQIACAVYCCDKAEYNQKWRPSKKKDCQRLGSKKHWCVDQALKRSPNPDVTPSPKFKPGQHLNVTRALLNKFGIKTAVPDIMLKGSDGNYLVDAKFPCPDTSKRIVLKGQVMESGPLARSMPTGKEKDLYPHCKVGKDKVKAVTTVSPAEAAMFGEPCKCKYEKA
ncbi:MAG: hypothetical protein QOI59_6654 [Gammaproteobacteria bacterium]|jgi:hypothetical protein|nr:hypothetical protein [Gammaproteobacteria bacterium]